MCAEERHQAIASLARKHGRVSVADLVSFAKPGDVDVLVTGRSLDLETQQSLIDHGMEVVLA